MNIDEITELALKDIQSYTDDRPYDYIDSIVKKYDYPIKGIETYDLVHDYYNKNYKECEPVARKFLSMRDYTFTVISWFNEENDIYIDINPGEN